MKNILVTGGAGFIGSNFVKYMLNQHDDCSIVNYDSLTYAGNLENLKDIENNDRYKFILGDVRDWEKVPEIFHTYDFDIVVNFAAESHVDRSIEDPAVFLTSNINIVKLILEALNKPESLIRYVTDRPGHDRRYAIDNTKIRTELGWQPAYTFEQGIKETINWYLTNMEWLERISDGSYREYRHAKA